MAPRPYKLDRRARRQQETRERILEATVALHAEKGSLATSYADIAARADVAVPTVYKHFSERSALIAGCVGHASKDAPPLGAECFADARDAPGRLRALFEAVYRRNAYFEPWLRWREERSDPDLATVMAPGRAALAGLIALALKDGRRAPAPETLALAEALCEYATWETLVRRHGLTTQRAAGLAAGVVAGLLESARPRSSK